MSDYSITDYGAMMRDRMRMDAHMAALRGAVTPGAVVLDLGTGTGIFALMAVRLGAARVYAIEPNEAIAVGRRCAEVNGLADRITFIQDLSTRVNLPERVDVIVSDLRGTLPLHGGHLEAIRDARRRFLKPDGLLISRRDTLWAAVVSAPKAHERLVQPWTARPFDLDLGPGLDVVVNRWGGANLKGEDLVSEPGCWATLDYGALESDNVRGEVRLQVARAAKAHGLALWFDADLADGIGFSTAPGGPETVYGRSFFPWPDEVQLEAGDVVAVTLSAHKVGGDYVWGWESQVEPARPGAIGAAFRQSTFRGQPLSAERLERWSSAYVPARSAEGDLALAVLEDMDGRRTAGEIARELSARYPELCPDPQAALTRVVEVADRFARRDGRDPGHAQAAPERRLDGLNPQDVAGWGTRSDLRP